MATRAVLTDIGREWLARWIANYPTWAALGTPYVPFAYHKWGEGGWQTVGIVDVPRDPVLFVGNNDLEIVENPGSYPGFGYYTGEPGSPSAGFPSGIDINYLSEVLYIGGSTVDLQVTARLDLAEENDTGSGNPRFFEVGIFDNALAAGLDVENHMIMYCTFDGYLKTNTRAVDVDIQLPLKP